MNDVNKNPAQKTANSNKPIKKEDMSREERLREELRKNLRKRKAQKT